MTSSLPKYNSAGGVVVRKNHDKVLIALINDDCLENVLPKGHVEENEDFETAAKREVAEEAGFTDLMSD